MSEGKGKDSSGARALLLELAEQLDSVIQEDPKKRSAGALLIRALIRQALKGDVRAIKECMLLAQRRRAGAESTPPPRRRGRPPTRIDLEAVQRLARLGMRDLSKVARVLGIPKQTFLGPKHGPAVRDAFETGRAFFEHDTLIEYSEALAQDRNSPLLALKVKQIGWSDRVQVVPPGAVIDSPVATMSDEELARFLENVARTLNRERQEAGSPSDAPVQPAAPPAPPPLPAKIESRAGDSSASSPSGKGEETS